MRGYLLFLLWSLVEVHSQAFPRLSFMGQTLDNNSYVDITLVGNDGSGSDSVQCITDLESCCTSTQGPIHRGDWYFPDGTRLPFPAPDADTYEARGAQRVDIRRRDNANSPTGIYRCDISTNAVRDDTDISVRDTVYVGLYTASGGDISISGGVTFDSDELTLTCISTGGPATTVTWTRGNVNITGEQNKTVLNDPVTAQYTHTLTVTTAGEYTCTVANNKPSSASSASTTVTGAPPPTGVTAVQTGPTSITVTWTPPDPLDGTTGYTISYTGGSSGSEPVSGGDTNSYILTSLTNGQTYTISIVATTNGLPSLSSQELSVGLRPDEPVATAMAGSNTSISLSWSAPSGSVVTSYQVEWSSNQCPDDLVQKEVDISTDTSYSIPGLRPGTSYNVSVSAINSAGATSSNTVTLATQEAAPSAAPANVTTTPFSTSIAVEWGPVDCKERNGATTEYSVRYGNETVKVSGDASGGMYTITGLMPSTTYSIEVAAVNGVFVGPCSTAVNELTKVAVPVLTVESTTATSISLSWTSAGSEGVMYEVNWQRNTSVGCIDEDTDNTTITGGSMTNYTITGLEEDSRYAVTVTAYNPVGNERSEPVTAMTMIAAPSAPPSPVSAMVESSTSITVQWGSVPCINQNGAITGYSVQYGVMGSGNTENMTVSGASTTQTTISGLNPSTNYSIQVAAVNNQLIGAYSSAENELTEVAVPVLMSDSTTATSISLSWTSGGSEGVSYEVEWERDTSVGCIDEDTNSTTITGGSMTNYTITGLEEDSRYAVTVTASNSLGDEPSNQITAMTLVAAPTVPPPNVTVTSRTSSTITVGWGEVPCIHQNGAITGYSVQYRVMGNGSTENMTVNVADVTETTISGLMPSTTYSIEVAAVNSAGTGVYIDPIIEETDEIKLMVSLVSSSDTSLNVSWTLPEEVTASYTISYSNTNNTDCFTNSRSGISASGTSHILTGLEERTEYSITVTATLSEGVGSGATDTLTGGGSEEGSITAATMTAAPSASPTDVRVSVESSTSVTVQWGPVECRHQNGEITGYWVRYGKEGSSEEEPKMVSGDSSGRVATVSGLTRETVYTVQVAAVTSGGTGEYSDPLTVKTPGDVFLSLNGVVIPDNGLLNISDIGSNDNTALLCITNRPPPSSGNPPHSGGDWFAPDGTRVPNEGVPGFVRNRGPMVVRLKRKWSETPAEGIYYCSIKDSTLTLTTVNVGLYNSGGGNITLSGGETFTLDSDDQFTLTCISTGGPATTVTWTRDSTTVTQGTQTVLNDPVTANYTHTLTVTGRLGGLYNCTVSNNLPSQGSAELSVTAPSPPTNVSVSQNGLTSLVVTWTQSEGPGITGYTIYYQSNIDGEEGESLMAGAANNSTVIKGLTAGAMYSISMVANSSTLPSDVTNGPNVTIERAIITFSSPSSTILAGGSVTITCSISLPSGVTGTPVLQWEGPGVTDSATKNDGSFSSNLTLSNISTSHAGVYRCTATLGGSVSADTSITVQVPTPIPFITNSAIIAGSGGSLTCSYAPDPTFLVKASATWTVGGRAVTDSEGDRISTDGASLVFSSFHTSDSGNYTCSLSLVSMESYIEVDQGPEMSQVSEIIVQIPPPDVAVSSNRGGPLYAGTGLSITCTATLDSSVNSDENLSISWSGQERIPSTIYSISSTTNHPVGCYISVLTISPLAVQDNGTFTCTVTVTGLDLSQSAISTNSTNVNVTDLPAPVVVVNSSDPTIRMVGDSLHLTCTATTVDHLTPGADLIVEWTGGNGGATQSETTVNGTTATRTLMFGSLNTTHGANYTCQASINISSINVTRNNSNSRDVTVQIPRPIVTVTAPTELVSGSNLTLTCSIQPFSVDTSTTVLSNWSTPGGRNNRVNETSPQLVISRVETADSGDYNCTVRVTDSTNSTYILDSPLAYNTTTITVKLNVRVSPIYEPAPGDVPGELDPNQFTAGSDLTLNCSVEGHSGALNYTWSLTGNPSTPSGCTSCVIDTSSTTFTLVVGRLFSYYAGDYTCTVSESGRPNSGNSHTFPVSVVGAGIYALMSDISVSSGPIANNGLIVSRSDDLRLECVSNSSTTGVGSITTPDGNILTPDATPSTLTLTNPFGRPGVLRLRSVDGTSQGRPSQSLPPSDQGVYTCTIPDSNGDVISLNVGLYPPGFNEPPTITNLTYHEGKDSHTLTCVSTGSPATNVSWIKDGEPLTSGYTVSQTVTDRRASTYSNVLTVSPEGAAGTYNCTVSNDLGSNSSGVVALGITVSGDDNLTVGQSGTISCRTNVRVSSIEWRNESSVLASSSSDNLTQLEYKFPLVTDNLHGQQYTCIAVAGDDDTYRETVSLVVKLPANPITVTTSVTDVGSPPAGEPGPTLICTVKETTRGLTNIPFAVWMSVSGPVVSGNGVNVTETAVNGTTTTSTLSFLSLYTSHAGLYRCVGTLESPPDNVSNSSSNIPVSVTLPAPEVSLSVPSGPLHQGTSLTLSCNSTLPPSVDTDVNVAIQWTPNITDNRITITSASSLQSPFISTLTISPLAMADTENFSCVASADSNSEYITSSDLGDPDNDTVTVTALPAPNVSISFTGDPPTAGEDYTISCSAEVEPGLVVEPDLKIVFPNATLTSVNNNSVLQHTFSPLTTSDGGSYTCTAIVNIPGARVTDLTASTAENITVKIPTPNVTFTSRPNGTLYSGTFFTLVCVVDLGPSVNSPLSVSTNWTKDGSVIVSDGGRITADTETFETSIIGNYESNVTFDPLSTTDSGDYSCSVEVEDAEFITGTTASGGVGESIEVEDLKPPMVGVGTEGVPTAGSDYSLVCTLDTEEGVRSEYISIIWTTPSGETKKAENVSDNGTTGELNFSPLNTSDRGDYICTGRIIVDSVMVNVSANSSLDINVTIPAPRVSVGTNAGDDGPFYQGTQLDIICSISVDASVNTAFDVNITWTRDDSESVMSGPNITISRANTSRLEFTSTLTIIRPLDNPDSAVYTCTAAVFPTDGERVLASNDTTASVNVSVEEPRAPNVTGATIVSEAGKPFSTECNFTAPINLATPPSVEWLNPSEDLVSSNKILSFPLLKTSDGGQYTCRVNFSIPSLGISESGNGTTRLMVQIPAPTITVLKDYTPYNGTKFNMTCTVEVDVVAVNTPITIHSEWVLPQHVDNSGTISNTSVEETKLRENRTLMFRPLRGEDGGTYTCTAVIQPEPNDEKNNIVGVSANETTDVIVQGLPEPTVRITLSSSAGSGTQECLGVDFGSQQANEISCRAGVTNSLLNPHTVTLMGDGGRINTSESGQNITESLQLSSERRTFTCSVCINIEEARIMDYCSSDDVTVSGDVPGEIRPDLINKTPDKITISWVDSAASIEPLSILRYIVLVERYVEAGPGKETTENVKGYPRELPGTQLQHTVQSLEKETPYVYTLLARNTEGCGPQSGSIFFTEEGVPTVPPHNVTVERINGTAMMVSFGKLSLVEARRVNIYYFVSYSPSGGGRKRQGGGREGPVEGNTTVVTGLDPSTGYDVFVFTATDEQGSRQLTSSEKMTAPRPQTSEPSGSSSAGAIIGGIVAALLVAIIVVAVILVVLWIKRARDRDRLQLFPKNKRDLYATPSSGNEMVTLRSTSPHESDEARKKEMEAINEESFSPVPVPQTVVADRLKPISVDSFRDHVNKMHEERDKGFEAEYQSLGSEPLASHEVAKRQHNRVKNRFANIFPYDESRVKLGEIPGEEGSDYINACWMDGYNRSSVYIAAQGPMPNTIADFWRMIWEYKIQHIVILTKCLEAGRRKCEQYWADNIGDVFETQDKKMEITTTSSMPFADFEIRTFNAKNTTEPDEKPLAVTQYHFTSWPDHGVPKFATSLISFIRRVQKAHNKEEGVPLLVHCSAGVGRTGTFMLLDSMLERIKTEKTVNVYEFLTGLRRKRVLMVQTLPQYVFIHDALCELITCGETDIAAPALKVKIQRLSKVIPGKGITGFQEQFQLLDQVSRKPEEDDCCDAREHFNRSKNRYADRLPYNLSRARLRPTGEDGSEYINASFLDGYKKRNAYIATQGPLLNTVGDFWRLMWEFKSKVMVMLCSLTEDGHEACHPFWPYDEGGIAKYGKITVTLQTETSYESFIQRKMLIQDDKAVQMGPGEGVVVTQFQLPDWPEHGRPVSTGAVVEMLDMITKAQMNTGNRAITILCNDGVGRTGTFICLHSQLERLKTEGVVDFFQAVKSARIQRAGLVPDADQYAYCHEVLADFVNSYDNYANFKDVV